jgi:ATP-dependent Clp protease ATP-binding subunit ClpC
MREQGISMDIDTKGVSYLIENGYSEEYGARPLKRLIQKVIENKVSEMIIGNEIDSGQELEISANDKGLTFNVKVREEISVH